MWSFLLKRVTSMILVLLGVTVLSFLIISLTPGDFLTTLSMDPEISPTRIARMKTEYGLDRPWYVQYTLWLRQVSPFELPFHWKWPNLGYSFAYNTPVLDLILQPLGNTLVLALSAEVLIWMLAIPLGVIAAMKKGAWVDRILSFSVYISVSIPEILLALVALLIAARTAWFPIGGMHHLDYQRYSFARQMLDLAHHLALPTMVLAISGFGSLMRYMKESLIDTLDAGYIRTAQAKGLSSFSIMWKHALPNAMNPMITLFGLSFGTLISNSFLVEIIMGWPGLGRLTYQAILSKDLYVIMASLVISTTLLILGNLTADMLLAWNDPRIRYAER